MRLARTFAALALPISFAIPFALLAGSAAAQHHAMVDKVDYDDPGGGDRDVPEGCVGVTNKVLINGAATTFSPSTITIDAGQPVCWTWNVAGVSHNLRADDGSFTTGPPTSQTTFQRTFADAGTYGYHCQVHGSPTGGMRGTVIVRSLDDPPESGPGTLSINPDAYTVDENAGELSITVERTGGSDGKVTVKIATGTGSAAKGKDFLPRTAVLTWSPGDAEAKTVVVKIKNDTLIEPDESFSVALSKVTGGATLGTSSASVTIHDDDGCPSSAPAAAPAALKASGQSAREIRLSWAADAARAKAVYVERRDGDGAFREIAALAGSTGDYVDAGLPNGSTFHYRLRVQAGDGLWEYSEIAAAATDGAIGACAGGAQTLCLGGGRFEAKVEFRAGEGEPLRAAIRAEAPAAARSGLFSFAPAGDAQLMLKVVDGCADNQHYWVQLAAVTDAELAVSVRDTETGRTWAFYNPAGRAAGAVRDVDAFGTCP